MEKVIENKFENFQESVCALMKEAQANSEVEKRIKGLFASIISTSKQYETAIEVALGNAIEYVITDNEEDAKYLIEVLNSKGIGRVVFLPISSVLERVYSPEILQAKGESGVVGVASEQVECDKYFEGVVKVYLGNTLVCDNIDTAIAIWKKYGHKFRIVTLNGEMFYSSGAIVAGLRGNNIPHLLLVK